MGWGEPFPPNQNPVFEDDRQAVLAAVKVLAGREGRTRVPDIDVWLEHRATAHTHWHLGILGDRGLVEWIPGPGDHGVATYVRLTEKAAAA